MSAPKSPLTRRAMLTRIGLAAGTAYVAPTMLHLTPAHASGASAPSAASRPRPASGPSRPRAAASRPGASRPSASTSRPGNSRPSRPASHHHIPQGQMPLWMLRLLGLA
jgi:hypothetical protein